MNTTDVSSQSLGDRISAFMQEMQKHAPPEVITAMGSELKKLAESGIVKHALQTGAKAPEFSLPNAHGGVTSLATYLAKGPVVVTFYRGGWCPFCDLQLRSYEQVVNDIHAFGAELIAISPQTPDHAKVDVEKKGLTFPVLTDAHNEVAKKYGLVFKLSDVLQKLQTQLGNPIPRFNGDESWELPMPGTFVLGRNGVVKLAHVDPNFTSRLEPKAVLGALRELAQ